MLILLLVLLWGAGLAYQVLAWACLRRFFRPAANPAASPPRQGPGVTVFKPVKGLEPDTLRCLETFLTQDYTPYQVLFGVADPRDPVLAALEELATPGAGLEMQVVLCPEPLGLNPKVSTLRQLLPRARYDILVIADADVRAPRDFLARAAAAVAVPDLGLVSCPYRGGTARTLGAQLEGLSIAADFIPAVAMARVVEGTGFALGAAMVLKREALEAVGGFAPLADYLADDYQLGYRIRQAGWEVGLLPCVVETVNPDLSLREYFLHQLRWSRTYRVCRPWGYLAYGITHATVSALGLWLASGLAVWAGGLLALTLILRGGLAWYSQRSCLEGPLPLPALPLVPLKDLLSFVFWLLAFLGNTVIWRGRRYRITPDGRLTAAHGRDRDHVP